MNDKIEHMFEYSFAGTHREAASPLPHSAVISAWVEYLAEVADIGPSNSAKAEEEDAELINQLRALEELKAAASAAQARAAAAFAASQRRRQIAAGMDAKDTGRGIASQVALARRESPNKGGRLLGLAKALHEMPYTFQAMTEGRLSEWRATLLVRETACLSIADRRRVDEEIAGKPDLLESLGDRQIASRARATAYRLDPAAAIKRSAKAAAERFVSCRPAPDTMTYLTGLLPVAQGVGVYAALSREADRLRAAGDSRGRGQIMADTLVERVTGLADPAREMRVEVQLVLTDRILFGGASDAASVSGYGPVPAQWARDLVRNVAGDRTASRWIRRLYAAPETGALTAMDSRARLFPASLARLIATRDQTCRTPWCGAPIRHIDHILPHRLKGPTSAENGQGLCQACNQAKEAPGWKTRTVQASAGPTDSGAHTVETTTPTGHSYQSVPPPLPGISPPPSMPKQREGSPAEAMLADFLRAA